MLDFRWLYPITSAEFFSFQIFLNILKPNRMDLFKICMHFCCNGENKSLLSQENYCQSWRSHGSIKSVACRFQTSARFSPLQLFSLCKPKKKNILAFGRQCVVCANVTHSNLGDIYNFPISMKASTQVYFKLIYVDHLITTLI